MFIPLISLGYLSFSIILIIIITQHEKEETRKIEQLESIVQTLFLLIKDKPIEFTGFHVHKKWHSLTNVLKRIEEKIRFLERHKKVNGIHLSRRFHSRTKWIQDLEQRTQTLEKMFMTVGN